MNKRVVKYIGKLYSDFPTKFGVPRQSGLVPSLESRIIMEPKYRNPQAFLGIEEYSHLWLLWDFSMVEQKKGFTATVCPPRLGGKEKRGVFATRSPFRPNPIGLSCVKLERMERTKEYGTVLYVSGADLMDQTPILDIKPYLPYTDSHPEALGGFGEAHKEDGIEVDFPEELLQRIPVEKREGLLDVLKQDPRAAFQKQPGNVYGMGFGEYDIRFETNESGQLVVCGVEERLSEGFKKVK